MKKSNTPTHRAQDSLNSDNEAARRAVTQQQAEWIKRATPEDWDRFSKGDRTGVPGYGPRPIVCVQPETSDPDASTPQPTTTKKRNKDAEAIRLAALRQYYETAEWKHQELLFSAQILILTGLPLTRTDKWSVSRSTRTSWGRLTVTYTSNSQPKTVVLNGVSKEVPSIPLPFGEDQAVLAWIITRCLQQEHTQENPDHYEITFRAFEECMDDLGLNNDGPTYGRLAERLKRIAAMGITIERTFRDCDKSTRCIVGRGATFPRRAHKLAARVQVSTAIGPESAAHASQPEESTGDYYTIRLSRDFVADCRRYCLPLPLPIMRMFTDEPRAWRFVAWLLYRGYACLKAAQNGKPGIASIPLHGLHRMLGSEDTNLRRFRARLDSYMRRLRIVWRELNAEFVEDALPPSRDPRCKIARTALVIRPPKNGFIPIQPRQTIRRYMTNPGSRTR